MESSRNATNQEQDWGWSLVLPKDWLRLHSGTASSREHTVGAESGSPLVTVPALSRPGQGRGQKSPEQRPLQAEHQLLSLQTGAPLSW